MNRMQNQIIRIYRVELISIEQFLESHEFQLHE